MFPINCLLLYAFRDKLKFPLYKNIVYIICMVAASTCLSNYLMKTDYFEGICEVFYAMIILILGVFVAQILLIDGKKEIPKIIFTLFLIDSMVDSIVLTARMYQTYFWSNRVLENLINEYFSVKFGFSALLFDVFFMMIAILCVFTLIKYFLYPIIKLTGTLSFWNYLWLIPVSFFLMFRFMIYPSYFCDHLISTKYSLIFAPIWIIGLFFVYLIIMQMLLQTVNNLQLQKELELSNLHMEMQKGHYKRLQKSIEEMRKTHHDNRHCMLMLQGHVKNHDYESLERDLNISLTDLYNSHYVPFCENYALDTVICNLLNMSKEEKIEITVKVKIPNDMFVTTVDLCILFGNLIENAYEACCRQTINKRFVSIAAEVINNNKLVICVKNSYEGEIIKRGNQYFSSKRAEEGIGLKSINSIAKKYNGTVRIEYQNGIFKSQLLLMAD